MEKLKNISATAVISSCHWRNCAAAATGTGSPGTIFAGQGQGGGDAVVGVGTAEDFDDGTLVASLGTVSLVKSVAIVDPFNGAEALR